MLQHKGVQRASLCCRQTLPTAFVRRSVLGSPRLLPTPTQAQNTDRGSTRQDLPEQPQAVALVQPEEDAFQIATMRLQKLLEEASWDSNEAVRAELATYSPAMKLTFLTNCGSLLTLIAFGVSWITGEDPLGGVTLTSSTLDAAMTGAIAAVPLVLLSVVTRLPLLKGALPLLEDLHATQAALLQPLVQGLNPSQLLIAASSTMLPTLLLLLPSMHGLASMLSEVAHNDVVQPVLAAGSSAQEAVLLSASSNAALAKADITQLAAVGDITMAQTTITMQASVTPSMSHQMVVPPGSSGGAFTGAMMQQHLTGDPSATNTSAPHSHPWPHHPSGPHQPAAATHAAAATTTTAVATPAPGSAASAASVPLGIEEGEVFDSLVGASRIPYSLVDPAADWGPTGWRAASTHTVHALPLSKPVLLPQGVPDLGETFRDGLMGLMEPNTAVLVRNVTREALALLPAVLSGFVAAYTVMRQLAPRRSQVFAIRDALLASDRYFRLTVSMNRGTAATTTPGTTEPIPSASEMAAADVVAADNGPPPPPAPLRATSPAPPPQVQRLRLVDQLAAAAAPAPVAPAVPSSAAASAAVSDAFRKVAVLWLLTRRKVCQLAYMLTALNMLLYALLWQETDDLAAPATAAVISVVVELWLSQRDAGVAEVAQERR